MANNDEVRKQWHGPFRAAMKLELSANKGDVEFYNEYMLSSKPIQIDLLIVKKAQNVIIDNEIGKIFRGHNILEYKSPGDELNVDTYFKVLGYACLYKSLGETKDSGEGSENEDISEDDITISFVREGYPRELIEYFRARGHVVSERYPGIYYVKGCLYPIQIIVSGKLDRKLHLWLTSLTRNMQEAQAEDLVLEISSLSQRSDKKNADSVLDLAMRVNPELFHKVKEENPMCKALLELFKPELDAALDASKAESVDNIIKNYGKSLESACQTIGITVETYRKVKAADQQKTAIPV